MLCNAIRLSSLFRSLLLLLCRALYALVRGFLTLATWHNGASHQEYNPLSLPRRSTTLKLFSASKPRHGLWSKPLSVQLLFLALFFLFFEKKISCAASCVFRDFRFQGHGSGVFFSVLSQCRSSVMSCLGFFCCLAPLFFSQPCFLEILLPSGFLDPYSLLVLVWRSWMYPSILGSCSSYCFQLRRQDLGFSWVVCCDFIFCWLPFDLVTLLFKICLWGKRNRGSSSWWRQAIQVIHILFDHLMLHLFLWWRVESRLGNIFDGLQGCSLLLLWASSVQVTWLWMYVQGRSVINAAPVIFQSLLISMLSYCSMFMQLLCILLNDFFTSTQSGEGVV